MRGLSWGDYLWSGIGNFVVNVSPEDRSVGDRSAGSSHPATVLIRNRADKADGLAVALTTSFAEFKC
ncbi:hypothetical protein [Halomicronema sp. CCY15110]|uniref:hypothetical protein n=1 Tax=Halomicronema sp. CCY15110 TaxID=2767773 RepID=UPI00194E1808|nr:hypothetical protein [Halomicronema sp. CCY15110]